MLNVELCHVYLVKVFLSGYSNQSLGLRGKGIHKVLALTEPMIAPL